MPSKHAQLNIRKTPEEGFTLIELLVTIVIIGALSAIAIPMYLNQTKQATEASIRSDVHNTSVNVASIAAGDPNMNATELQAAVSEEKAILESSHNEVTVSGTGMHYFICGETPDGQTEGYSSAYGVIEDCVLGQNPPVDALNSTPTP